MNLKWIPAFGGIVVIMGSVLPWATVEVILFGQQSIDGLDGDGVITLPLGIVMLILALTARKESGNTPPVIAGLLALAAGSIGLYDLTNVRRINPGILGEVSVGVGLYLVVIGAGVAIVGSLSWYGESKSEAVSSNVSIAEKTRRTKSVPSSEGTCPKCGTRVRSGAMYCICGERIQSKRKTRSKKAAVSSNAPLSGATCPKCGAIVKPGAMYCVCGERIRGHSKTRDKKIATSPGVALVDGACPKCGADVRPNALYCDHCGQRIKH